MHPNGRVMGCACNTYDQVVAVRCSVLLCVAVCGAEYCHVCCSVLQCVAVSE